MDNGNTGNTGQRMDDIVWDGPSSGGCLKDVAVTAAILAAALWSLTLVI